MHSAGKYVKNVAIPAMAVVIGFGLVALLRPAATETTYFSSASQDARWGKSYLPNLPVVDQDGKVYRFYDDLIQGRKVIVNFVFTSCSAICPLTMARMVQLKEKLGDIPSKDLKFYSITVDPEHDGPAELKRYADAFQLGPDWKMLTGKPEDLQIIRDKLGERSRMKSEHRHEMLIGNDPIGDWSKDSAYGDLDRVALNIRSMDPVWQRSSSPATVRSANSDFIDMSDTPGEALYVKACASCHTVGHGDRVGPDLQDVSTRRDRAWLTRIISRPDAVLASNDPIARELKTRFPTVAMPNLGLSEQDAADVLHYIDSKSGGDKGSPGKTLAATIKQ